MKQFKIYRDETKTIYADDIPEFPNSEYWGNLSNKVLFMFYRLEYSNRLLDSIFSKINLYNFNLKKRNRENNNETTIIPHIEIIHIMSDLRMILDEMIALLYILEQREIIGDYPQVIQIDSIGAFLELSRNANSESVQFFIDYKEYLKLINDISNTYKHSFLNDHVIFYRQLQEPTVFAIKTATVDRKKNKFDLETNKLIAVPLEKIIDNFNEMFEKYLMTLKDNAHQQIVKDFENKRRS